MSSYTFTLATAADIPGVAVLYQSNVGTPGCTWSEKYPTTEDISADIAAEALYILRDGESIIAAAAMNEFGELGHLPWGINKPCELARLGVIPHRHRQGIGSLMLWHAINAAKAKGFGGLCILVSRKNPAALGMYLKSGFEICGETRMYDIDFHCCKLDFATEI